VRNSRAQQVEVEGERELVEDQVGRDERLQVPACSQVGEAKVEGEPRACAPGDGRRVGADRRRRRRPEPVLHPERVPRAGRQDGLQHPQFRVRAPAEVVVRQLGHRNRRSVERGGRHLLAEIEDGIAVVVPGHELDGRLAHP
jgi:hypothetical protein